MHTFSYIDASAARDYVCYRESHVIRHFAIERTKDNSRRERKCSRGCVAKITFTRRIKNALATVMTPLPCDSLIESFIRVVLRERACFYTDAASRSRLDESVL